ncbi:hypothetical protein [Mycobacterium sp. OAE908]
MPTRKYSAMIVGGLWPLTDPETFHAASEVQHSEGVKRLQAADSIRGDARQVANEQSGQFVDGFCNWCYDFAATCTEQADKYFAMARTSEEAGRLLYGLRADLDEIDQKAHEEIGRLEQQPHGLGQSLLIWSQIEQVLATARAEAMTKSATATAAMQSLAPQVAGLGAQSNSGKGGAGADSQQPGTSDPVDPQLRQFVNEGRGMGGGRGPGGMPLTPPPSNGDDGANTRPTSHEGQGLSSGPPSDAKGGSPDSKGGSHPGSAGLNGPAGGDETSAPGGDGETPIPTHVQGGDLNAPPPPRVPPPLSRNAPSVPASPISSPSGGGMQLPSAPSGMSGGLPTQGLTSPMSGGLPTNAAGGMAPPPTPAAELSRGFNAGFGASGGPAAPLMPPVQSPPPTAGGGAPSGGFASGPAPVSAASGAPAVTGPPTPVAAPTSPPAVPGGAGVPAGPVGPLPPFGSDIPSAPAPSGAVSPAAGGASGSPAASGISSSSAPVAPLPPGVVGSGVGASAGAASEGIRSSLPDPLLESAEQIVYQLLHASRLYLFLDWCVGMFRTRSGVETIIVSSEGTGYIPQGVFVPRAARMLFSDPTLGPRFASRWFSWANPAETMVAFAELVTTNNPNVELWALAVSTDHGGSSAPAREAGVPHFAECSVNSAAAIRDDAPAMALDSQHLHRLETLDHAEYTRLIGLGDGRRPDQSEAWRTTVTAADTTMRRAGELLDFVVPPVVREVIDLLGKGVRVPPDCWVNLQSAMLEAVGTGAALRPGRMPGDMPASAHARSYHDLARLMEMLLLWNLDETDNEIKYPELAYLARQIELSAATE